MTLTDPSLRVPLESLPVFPLPNTVFFPEQRLPLHIFEPRYRQLVRDALEGAPYLVVARIDPAAPGTEPFARVATAGRIVAHQKLPDGRFNILVEGAVRVAVEEIPSEALYRRVRCTPLGDPGEEAAAVDPRARAAMLSLVALVMRVARARTPDASFDPPAELPAGRLAWRIAERLVSDAAWRQRILEAPTPRDRVDRTTEALAQTLNELTPGTSPGGLN